MIIMVKVEMGKVEVQYLCKCPFVEGARSMEERAPQELLSVVPERTQGAEYPTHPTPRQHRTPPRHLSTPSLSHPQSRPSWRPL